MILSYWFLKYILKTYDNYHEKHFKHHVKNMRNFSLKDDNEKWNYLPIYNYMEKYLIFNNIFNYNQIDITRTNI
jgi:hypothetical protein